MARVTVEDCIDKVENRFDLVLLASHRARMISSGGQIAVERDNDKNPVVALREIADKAVSPEDLREELVHALQKYVEVDEPEPEGIPLIGAPGTGIDADDTEVTTDRMSEEELLKGLEGLTPPESQPEPDADVGDEEKPGFLPPQSAVSPTYTGGGPWWADIPDRPHLPRCRSRSRVFEGQHSSHSSAGSTSRLPTRKRRLSCGLRRSKASSANRIWPAWRQRVASYRLRRSSA